MALPKLAVTGLDNENQRRRLPESVNGILDHSFDDSRRTQDDEKVALVIPTNPAYAPGPEIEIERYDGVTGTDSSYGARNNAAVTRALAVIDAIFTKGGTIKFGRGYYFFDSAISLNALRGITFQGVSGLSGGAAPGTVLVYTGTASSFIDMRGALGCFFKNIDIQHNNAGFTGTLILAGNNGSQDSFRCGLHQCNVGSSVGSSVSHVDLDGAIEFVATECLFHYGEPSIIGQSAGSYSNVVTFNDCTWTNSGSVPVVRPGESWTFNSCTFEALADGTAGAIDSGSTSTPAMALGIYGCWFGDVTAGGGTWIYHTGQGLNICGNRFGGHATSTFAINIEETLGAKIEGNTFDTFTAVLNFADADSRAISYKHNYKVTVTNDFSNSANAPNDLAFEFTPNSPQVTAEPSVAAYESYTPSWTASTTNPTLGNGTLSGRYTKHDRMVTTCGQLTIGSTTTNGTGNYFISVPFIPATAMIQTGACYLLDSGTGFQVGTVRTMTDGTARIQFIFHGAGNVMGAAVPVVPATGDELHWTITYLT